MQNIPYGESAEGKIRETRHQQRNLKELKYWLYDLVDILKKVCHIV